MSDILPILAKITPDVREELATHFESIRLRLADDLLRVGRDQRSDDFARGKASVYRKLTRLLTGQPADEGNA